MKHTTLSELSHTHLHIATHFQINLHKFFYCTSYPNPEITNVYVVYNNVLSTGYGQYYKTPWVENEINVLIYAWYIRHNDSVKDVYDKITENLKTA